MPGIAPPQNQAYFGTRSVLYNGQDRVPSGSTASSKFVGRQADETVRTLGPPGA